MTEEERRSRIEEIKNFRKMLLDFDVEGLSRGDLGSLNFTSIRPRFDFLKELLSSISDRVLTIMVDQKVIDLFVHLQNLNQQFVEQVKAFRLDKLAPGSPAPAVIHENLLKVFDSSYDQLVQVSWVPALQSSLDTSRA